MHRAIFLDRDGTLLHDVGYAYRLGELRLLDHAVAGLCDLQRQGFLLLLVTNQSGVARGYFSEDDVRYFHAALCAQLAEQGVTLAGVYYCPFHPDAAVGTYRQDSPLRKPRPGMLLQAAAEHGIDLTHSFMVGDQPSDIAAGRAAGCRTILLRTASPPPALWDAELEPDLVAADLLEAARLIRLSAPTA
jgi:D-glycero-D-manno-heptose 1,7-bisphosphate phosphatase